MADVITRFRLETTQYDSKLRDSAKSLQAYGKQAELAGKDFTNFSQKAVEAARSLGTIASGANNTKDKLKDLVGAYNDVAKTYNKLTEQQRQTDFGKAMSQSLEQLQVRIKETKQELYGLGDAVKGGGGLFGGGKLDGMLQVFGGNLMTKAAGLALGAVTSLTSEIEDAVKQGIELAKQGEGIRIAFERLNKPGLLDNLREATHGTVTNLELMEAAVKFNDFKLPVEELGTMLAFAQQKAKDTGQSIDYMVDSIVTGLGRKSLMILDNLGLSAAEIKEKMKETGDMTKAVGEIIREQMSKAGDYVETAADRATKADVELKNAMEDLGRVMQPLTEESNNLWNSIKVGAINALTPVMELIARMTDAGKLRNQLGNLNAPTGGMNSAVDAQLQKLRIAKAAGGSNNYVSSTYQGQIEEYNRTINAADKYVKQFESNRSKINTILQEASKEFGQKFGSMADLKAYQGAFKKMRDEYKQGAKEIMSPVKVDVKTSEAETNIESLKKKLADLEAQRKKAIAAGDTDLSKNLAKQISQVKSDIKGLGGSTTNKTTTNTVKTEEQLNNDEIQKLTQEYIKASDDRRKAIEGEIKTLQDRNAEIKRLMEAAQGKSAPDGSLKALSEELSKLQQERQLLSDPIDIELHDQAIKDVQDEIDRLNGKKVEVELAVDNRTPFEKLRDSLKIEIAEENMQVDTTTLQTLMKTAIQNGVDGLDPQFASLQEKMREGMNIPDSAWEDLQTQINEKLKGLGIEPIKIEFKTGNLAKDGKDTETSWKAAAQAVQSVGGAMQSIEDPAAKVAGTIAQAIASIALGYAQATTQAATLGPWAWVAFAATGMAQMISMISAIHSSTGYANGGIVNGNSYSGDNIPAMVGGPSGELVGLNAGEVVLNKAQQSTLASELQNGGNRIQVVGRLSGEQLFICAENWAKRTGKGEFVTWR